MKQYEIQYFNYLGQCEDCFYIIAKDEEDAERIFRKIYDYEITGIYEYSLPHFWTEEELAKLLEKRKNRQM